jgi:sulfhydrogenase subunit beta (sulfur reductase)
MSETLIDKKQWLISQTELNAWLDGIAEARTLVAPRQVSKNILYRPVANSKEIAWQSQLPNAAPPIRPTLSIKEIYFPSTERLFTINKNGQEIVLKETFPDWETVVFGVRPCDARGVKILDALFLDTNPIDVFYSRRRSNTTLIGLACNSLRPSCFCTSVGGAPDDAHDVDIMLSEVEGGFLVRAVTEKGRFLIPGGEWEETTDQFPRPKLNTEFSVIKKGKLIEHFNDPYWINISERCVSCRACAYVCPTCRCFIVRDEMIKSNEFERIRCWDSCSGKNYRRLAGGHRPRAEKNERMRNRIFCKFYYYPEQYGLAGSSACTGCGRCIEVCHAGVDITEVLLDLEKMG